MANTVVAVFITSLEVVRGIRPEVMNFLSNVID